jgi:hypothetical protein
MHIRTPLGAGGRGLVELVPSHAHFPNGESVLGEIDGNIQNAYDLPF